MTLLMGVALTAALGWQMHREAVALDRQRLALRVAEITSQLDARIEKSEMLLHNLRDYLTLSGENRNQVFARWCYENGLSINCPWIHGIAVATNRNTAQWRAEPSRPLETWTMADWDTLEQSARLQVADCRITLTSELPDRKQFLPDYRLERLLWDKDRLAQTIRESRASMSDLRPVIVDASSNRLRGAILYVPIYKRDVFELLALPGLTRNQSCLVRWMHLNSVILAPVDFKILADSIWDGSTSDLEIEIFSSTNQTAETFLYNSSGTPRAAGLDFKAYLTHRQPWPMYGQTFSIFFHTTPLFEAQSPRRLERIAMAAGTGLTVLATALVGVAVRARDRQARMTEQIREARDALSAAQRERQKISRDLHDGTIQSLYAIQLGLGRTAANIKTNPVDAQIELSAVCKEMDAVIAEIRQYITSETGVEKAVDFGGVLHSLVQRAQTGSGARISCECDPNTSASLTGDQAVHLANIAREALSNCLRHARPQQVEIVLNADGESVVLRISDDGTGFDPKTPSRSGVGLTSMTTRAKEMHGTLEVQSARGEGTRVVVRIPVSSAEKSRPKKQSGPIRAS